MNRQTPTFYFLDLLAAAVSDQHATRNPSMLKMMVGDRDYDGNIVGYDHCEVRTWDYKTANIPSYRFENLLKIIAVDSNQALLLFHQLIQGKTVFDFRRIFNYDSYIFNNMVFSSLLECILPIYGRDRWFDG